MDADTLAAYGLGLDVRRALEWRREVVRARGRADVGPSVAFSPELERRAVGERMAARTGRVFLADVPDGFRGRLEVGPEGSPFAVISDGSRFVLVGASPELRGLAGRAVEVRREHEGRLGVRALDRGRQL